MAEKEGREFHTKHSAQTLSLSPRLPGVACCSVVAAQRLTHFSASTFSATLRVFNRQNPVFLSLVSETCNEGQMEPPLSLGNRESSLYSFMGKKC